MSGAKLRTFMYCRLHGDIVEWHEEPLSPLSPLLTSEKWSFLGSKRHLAWLLDVAPPIEEG